jgi:hypothetical protein
MKQILLTVALMIGYGAGVALAGGLSPAAEKEFGRPGVVVTDILEVKATIDSIDYKKRMMTLRGLQGRTIALKADRAVRNFEQLRKGDVVLADFVESIAIFMRSARAPQSPAEARLVSVAPKGSKLGVLLAETVQLTAIVEFIDTKARQVTLKESHGGSRVVPVDKSFKNLDRFKKGEEVVMRITEAIAIKVEKRM